MAVVSFDELKGFYSGKKVFVTGHTGFKGTWLTRLLLLAGAQVTGYSLDPPTDPSLFVMADIARDVHSVIGDIRDLDNLSKAFEEASPEIVFHLAAQPLVRESYLDPVYTFETNVMGTVNLLDCIRKNGGVRSVVNVITDKVYLNREWEWGYRETDELCGYDPYSNSKSCSELVTSSYINSFFDRDSLAVSTARAGNVIGGGDFAKDRVIPDCVRAVSKGSKISVRNPGSTRPYQHVLEPVFAYLMIAARQYDDPSLAGKYNIGPDDSSCVTTGELVSLFVSKWGEGAAWSAGDHNGPHEANFLRLDCSKLRKVFGWRPVWTLETAVEKTVEWSKCMLTGGDVRGCMDRQIKEYITTGTEERQ